MLAFDKKIMDMEPLNPLKIEAMDLPVPKGHTIQELVSKLISNTSGG